LSAAPVDERPSPDGRPRFDLLVQGGELVGPGTGRSGRYDVAVKEGRVASVAPDIPRHLAAEVVDARGCIVVPGLVDLHTHLFFGGTYWGVDPRPVAWRTGVTSWVDAGSAGAYNIAALRRLSAGLAPLHTRAFVNISSIGLVAETGEARRQDLCDPGLCAAAAEEHRDFVVGIKCRLDRFATGEMGLAPLRLAVQAAAVAGLPVMAHIGGGPPDIDDVLDLLRPGDLVTHCTTGQDMSLVIGKGRLRPSAMRARERGVLFDVGHGSGGFSFAVAESMLAAGAPPDVISSDLHQRSVLGPGFDLPTCMSKFLAIGMSLEDVVRAATTSPARVFAGGRSAEHAGSLAVGEPADLAIFELEVGDFALYDTYLECRQANRFFVNRATVVAGVPLAPVASAPPAHWIELTPAQRALFESRAAGPRRPWATILTEPDNYLRLSIGEPPNMQGE
jgi:dihydroorotase